MLVLDKIRSGYEGSEVLHGISMKMDSQKITSIIGPNGAGKTTMLKTILRMVTLRSGSMVLDKDDISSLNTSGVIRKGIAYVPQGSGVFPAMTVEENLQMGGYVCARLSQVNEGIQRATQVFPILKERLKQKAGYLSGGERKMLAIARGLVSSPTTLLLDEPSLGLDIGRQELIFDKLVELNKTGLTVVLAEQNIEKALELSHWVYVLTGGQVSYSGEPKALVDKSRLVELFFGGKIQSN